MKRTTEYNFIHGKKKTCCTWVFQIAEIHSPKTLVRISAFWKTHSLKIIGHFRVLLCLCLKTSLSFKTFHSKTSSACNFIFMPVKVIFMRIFSHLDSLWNRGTRELGNGIFQIELKTVYPVCQWFFLRGFRCPRWPWNFVLRTVVSTAGDPL